MGAEVIEPEAQLGPIAALCDGPVSYRTDGWRKLIHMISLRFLVDGVQRKADAVLCLNHNNPTYPTKLYLSENVGGTNVNWHETAFNGTGNYFRRTGNLGARTRNFIGRN